MAPASPRGAVAVAAGSCAAAATGNHHAAGRKMAADRETASAAADQAVPRSCHLRVVAPREAQR